MMFHLDDDTAAPELARMLRNAGYDARLPVEVGLRGQDDAVHLTHAIREDRVCLTHNYKHFENLHNLVIQAGGHHSGILAIRRDNDPTRDMTPRSILRAIRKLAASGLSLKDQFWTLNHWR